MSQAYPPDFLERLHQAICQAYDLGELRELFFYRFSEKLDVQVTTDTRLDTVVFELLVWADKSSRMPDLLEELAKGRPRRPDLAALRKEYAGGNAGGAPPGAPSPGGANGFRKAVEDFSHQFQARTDEFRYLNACKELHDLLHELQAYQPQLVAAVAARSSDPGRPLADDAALALRGWLDGARQSAGETEFPEEPSGWIARLATAVEELTGPDPARFQRALERVVSLPAKELGKLNGKLIYYARRLQALQLLLSLERLRAAMGTDGAAPSAERLRGALESFRTSCSQLVGLIQAHDLCQKVDDAVRVAGGLAAVTRDKLPDWDDAADWLGELAKRRPDDFRVVRTAEAARQFEAATDPTAAATAFATFSERFEDLFLKTDKALLSVTNQLQSAALRLQGPLEEFQ